MHRRGAAYGSSRRRQRVGSGLSNPDTILLGLGSSLLHWWEPRYRLITFNVNNIQQIDPLAGAAALVQLTVGQQPTWSASGGPGGTPYSGNPDGSDRKLVASLPSYAAGRRLSSLIVFRGYGTVDRFALALHPTGTTDHHILYYFDADANFKSIADLDGASRQTLTITSPAVDTDWHAHETRLPSSGAAHEIDASSTTPDFTGTAGLQAIDELTAGYPTTTAGKSGHDWSSIIIWDDAVGDPAGNRAAVHSYVAAQFGISG